VWATGVPASGVIAQGRRPALSPRLALATTERASYPTVSGVISLMERLDRFERYDLGLMWWYPYLRSWQLEQSPRARQIGCRGRPRRALQLERSPVAGVCWSAAAVEASRDGRGDPTHPRRSPCGRIPRRRPLLEKTAQGHVPLASEGLEGVDTGRREAPQLVPRSPWTH
jgi:hypothetical protein